MSNILDAAKESSWISLGKNLVETAAANSSSLGLTAAQVTGLENTYALFVDSTANAEAKTAEKESAVKQKEVSFAAFESLVRRYAKQWRANTSVSDSLLSQLQLAPRNTPRTFTNPNQPLALLATANSVGEITLKWKRNGNLQGTTFVIEHQTSPTSWNVIGTTTKTRFSFMHSLGVEATYRIIAVRRNIQSTPSFPVTIFDDGETVLSIAA